MPYLEDWEKSVNSRKGFDDGEKKRMLLSQETLDGIRMTSMFPSYEQWSLLLIRIMIPYYILAKSFVELVRYVLGSQSFS